MLGVYHELSLTIMLNEKLQTAQVRCGDVDGNQKQTIVSSLVS